MQPGNNAQIDFAVMCFKKYARIRDDNGYRPPSDVDIDHSSLLLRLLSGKEPLPKPPPKRHSYPCYDLGEGKPVRISELWQYDDESDKVVIDQSPAWNWIDKTQGILLHNNGDKYKFTPAPEPHGILGILQKIDIDKLIKEV